ALGKTSDVIANAIHNPHKFMANYHRHRNRFLRPRVPVEDVHVRAADGCFQDADEHIIAANIWNRNLLEPETRLRFGFDNRLHHRLHDSKLGEAWQREKIFARQVRWREKGFTFLKDFFAKAIAPQSVFLRIQRFFVDTMPVSLAKRVWRRTAMA